MENKRGQFVIVTIIATALFSLLQLVRFNWQYQAIFGFVSLVSLSLFLLFLRWFREKKNLLAVLFLPALFFLAITFFRFFFAQNWFWQVLIIIIFAFLFYTILLVTNVFLVSAEIKVVPLYRAASTVSFLLILIISFFLLETLFSFYFPFWQNGLIVFFLGLPIFNYLFWTISLSHPLESDNLLYSFIFSLIIAQMSMGISFWPVGPTKGSLFIAGLIYVLGGLAEAQRRERLFRRTVLEFIWVGVGVFLGLFLVTSWS